MDVRDKDGLFCYDEVLQGPKVAIPSQGRNRRVVSDLFQHSSRWRRRSESFDTPIAFLTHTSTEC